MPLFCVVYNTRFWVARIKTRLTMYRYSKRFWRGKIVVDNRYYEIVNLAKRYCDIQYF